MHKIIKIRGIQYKMHQARSTGWVFVRSKKTGRTYSIAHIANGRIIELEGDEALRGASNEELANAWLAQIV